jgi:hypothetical protein
MRRRKQGHEDMEAIEEETVKIFNETDQRLLHYIALYCPTLY